MSLRKSGSSERSQDVFGTGPTGRVSGHDAASGVFAQLDGTPHSVMARHQRLGAEQRASATFKDPEADENAVGAGAGRSKRQRDEDMMSPALWGDRQRRSSGVIPVDPAGTSLNGLKDVAAVPATPAAHPPQGLNQQQSGSAMAIRGQQLGPVAAAIPRLSPVLPPGCTAAKPQPCGARTTAGRAATDSLKNVIDSTSAGDEVLQVCGMREKEMIKIAVYIGALHLEFQKLCENFAGGEAALHRARLKHANLQADVCKATEELAHARQQVWLANGVSLETLTAERQHLQDGGTGDYDRTASVRVWTDLAAAVKQFRHRGLALNKAKADLEAATREMKYLEKVAKERAVIGQLSQQLIENFGGDEFIKQVRDLVSWAMMLMVSVPPMEWWAAAAAAAANRGLPRKEDVQLLEEPLKRFMKVLTSHQDNKVASAFAQQITTLTFKAMMCAR